MIRNRLLESWWAGRTAWLLSRTTGRWRHRDLHRRLREAALEVGAGLVALRHGAPVERTREAVDHLAWLAEVARACGALGPDDARRLREALDTLQPTRARGVTSPLEGRG